MIYPTGQQIAKQEASSPTVQFKGTTLDALLAKNAKNMTANRQPFSSAYMSRGYSMVRAALSDKPKNLKESDKTKSFSVIEAAQAKLQHERRIGGATKPKAMVGFREPLVTKQYKYEQTFVPVPYPGPGSDEDDGDGEENLAINEQPLENHDSRPLVKENIEASELKNIDDYLTIDDDSEEDVFSLDANSFDQTDFDESICNNHEENNTPKKRTHEMIEEEESIDSNNKKKIEEESLFSPPKVAKIAPYYDHNEPTNLPSANQRVTSIRRSHGIKSVSPQLLKFQASPQFDDKPLDKEPKTLDSGNEFRYLNLSWISNSLSYLSDRVTRLIF